MKSICKFIWQRILFPFWMLYAALALFAGGWNDIPSMWRDMGELGIVNGATYLLSRAWTFFVSNIITLLPCTALISFIYWTFIIEPTNHARKVEERFVRLLRQKKPVEPPGRRAVKKDRQGVEL